ncbi:MAG: L-aspartate oxidase [Proteobacteria bacterium]|jgi:L-aspartate oxidase|nr:L-aspartate oxidase [Alphaproteobacteria bacterium]NCC03710.1 L-aspartate oxidase [Pseudomonadota bacterium]
MSHPPVIVGAGLAGLSVALSLAPLPVVVLGRKLASQMTSSELAQGGIAAAVGPDDTPALHAQDTMAAGAGLCDPAVVEMITKEAPKAIAQLSEWGVPFDRDEKGELKVGLEGAHSRRRIVHANGDATGPTVMKALVERARHTLSITFVEDAEALRILLDDKGEVSGLLFYDHSKKQTAQIRTRQIILATGSACALWQHATVPPRSWGHGLLLAHQVEARLSDLAFVQFHPTGLDIGCDPMPLVSEAVRGEGAMLVNEMGDHFVDELAPRDVVARAISAQIKQGHKTFLDARHLNDFAHRFPTVFELCQKGGIDPVRDLIPICPVAHYHMGGIATDRSGRTNVHGLWACGECACTGLHGANRLASNSLLEATVMGRRVADDLRDHVSMRMEARITEAEDFFLPEETTESIAAVREIMTQYVYVQRDAAGLQTAIEQLSILAKGSFRAQVGLLIARDALARQQSCGAHYRTDQKREQKQESK